ncbi:MAG: hypothetical protein Aurels2KO_57750 [Aureliella sp.]
MAFAAEGVAFLRLFKIDSEDLEFAERYSVEGKASVRGSECWYRNIGEENDA